MNLFKTMFFAFIVMNVGLMVQVDEEDDFGFSKEITPRLISKFGTTTPNQKFMLVGLLLKIKEITGKINLNHYKIFKKYLSSQDKDLFKI